MKKALTEELTKNIIFIGCYLVKFNNLSNNKKKELEEIYINNYSLFNSI